MLRADDWSRDSESYLYKSKWKVLCSLALWAYVERHPPVINHRWESARVLVPVVLCISFTWGTAGHSWAIQHSVKPFGSPHEYQYLGTIWLLWWSCWEEGGSWRSITLSRSTTLYLSTLCPTRHFITCGQNADRIRYYPFPTIQNFNLLLPSQEKKK